MYNPWAVIKQEHPETPNGKEEPTWEEAPTLEEHEMPWDEYQGAPDAHQTIQPYEDEPPWEAHARALELPPMVFPPPQLLYRLPQHTATKSASAERSEQAAQRERSRSRSAPHNRQPIEQGHSDYPHNPNPTAIRGWEDTKHVEDAIREAGLPAPHTMYRHQAGFMRYTTKSAIVNYYMTTRTVLVQGRQAGLWDEKMRAARVQTRP